jgi:hypothetical protein
VLALTAMAALPALRTQRFLWAWMAAFWVQLLLQNKYLEYHFVPWILPVAVCLGVLASEVRSRLARIPNVIPRALASTALAGLLALVVVRHLPYFVDAARIAMGAVPREAHDRGAVFHVFRYTDSQRAAEIVRSVTAPADRILVYAFDPSVYLMSGRRSMSRHVSNFPIRDADWFPAHVRTAFFEELCRDVVASPPRALVTDFFALQGFDRVTRDGREILRFCGLELDGAGVAGHFWVFRPSQPSPGPR